MNLTPNPDNPRTITDEAFKRLKEKIKRNPDGLDANKIVHKDGIIIAGNQRWRAINELNLELKDNWFKDVSGWTDEQIREYLVTSNISDGEWDMDMLANQYDMEELEAWGLDLPLPEDETEVEEDEVPEVSPDPPVSELGKIYQLGKHRVMCGDSISVDDLEKLVDKQKIEMAFTDPPYLMGFEGNVHADGSKSFNAKHGAIKNDKMSREDGDVFVYSIFESLKMTVSGAYYVCFYRLGLDYIFRALDKLDNKYRALIIWDKGNHTLSNSDYMSKYEPIVYGWFNEHNFKGNRSNFDIWSIDRTSKNELHPTMKPVELCAKAINNSSSKGDAVLDLFLGSGSTLIACEQTDRICYGMELDPKYVDVIRKRYAKFVHPDTWEERWQELTPEIAGEKRDG